MFVLQPEHARLRGIASQLEAFRPGSSFLVRLSLVLAGGNANMCGTKLGLSLLYHCLTTKTWINNILLLSIQAIPGRRAHGLAKLVWSVCMWQDWRGDPDSPDPPCPCLQVHWILIQLPGVRSDGRPWKKLLSFVCLAACLVGWLVGGWVGGLVGGLVGWLVGWFVGLLVGGLVCWFVGLLVCLFVGRFVGVFGG